MKVKSTMTTVVAFGLLALLVGLGGGTGDDLDELILSRGRISTVLKVMPASQPGRWVLVCDRIDFPGGTVSLAASPLWSLDIRPVLPGPERLAPILKEDGDDLKYRLDGGAALPLPRSQLRLSKLGDSAARLEWLSVPDPYGGLLDVSMEFSLTRQGFQVQLEASRRGNEAALIISALYPVLHLEKLGDQSSDDFFIHPLVGDALFRNPLASGICYKDLEEDYARGWTLAYPGEVQLQMEMFYSETERYGFILMALDPRGRLKKLMGLRRDGPAGHYLEFYVRAYQEVEATSKEEAVAAMQRFRSPYPVAVEGFIGDWHDGADLYRERTMELAPAFLAGGTLHDQRDDPLGPHEEQLMAVGINYHVPSSVSYNDPDTYLRLLDTIEFFHDWGLNVIVILPGIIKNPPASHDGLGRDAVPSTLREGVAEFVDKLFDLPGVVGVIFNRDAGGWPLEPGSATWEAAQEHGREGIVWNADGTMFKRTPTATKGCSGSEWLRERRLENLASIFEQSREGGRRGFSGAFISGSAAYPQPCYAPALFGLPDHRHPVGGGDYNTRAFREVGAELAERYAPTAPAPFVLMSERGHEWLIGRYVAFQVARSVPFFAASLGHGGRYNCGWQPLPLTAYVWHDYLLMACEGTLLSALVRNVDWDPEAGEAYDGAIYKLAYEAIVTGRIPGVSLIAADTMSKRGEVYLSLDGAYGYLGEPPPGYDHLVADLAPGARKVREYVRALGQLRALAREWLVFGRMLPSGELESPKIEFQAETVGAHGRVAVREVRLPAVLGGAYRSPDGHVGLFAANTSPNPVKFGWRFTPAEWGLEGGKTYLLVRHPLPGDADQPPPDEVVGEVAVTDPEAELALPELELAGRDSLRSLLWLELMEKR